MLFAFGPLQIVHVNVAHYATSIAWFFLKDAQNYPYLLKLCIFFRKKESKLRMHWLFWVLGLTKPSLLLHLIPNYDPSITFLFKIILLPGYEGRIRDRHNLYFRWWKESILETKQVIKNNNNIMIMLAVLLSWK